MSDRAAPLVVTLGDLLLDVICRPHGPIADDTDTPRLTKAVQWLIAINLAVYFLQVTVVGGQNMLPVLGFQAQDLSRAWWTIGTYMFVHGGFWHLALNIYMLYVFGPRVEHAWSATEFTKFYIAAGLGGWLFHLVFARDALLIGSSAAVLGVALAYALVAAVFFALAKTATSSLPVSHPETPLAAPAE